MFIYYVASNLNLKLILLNCKYAKIVLPCQSSSKTINHFTAMFNILALNNVASDNFTKFLFFAKTLPPPQFRQITVSVQFGVKSS